MPKVKAVIFDFDGVLFNLKVDWNTLKQKVFALAQDHGIDCRHGKLNVCLEAMPPAVRKEAMSMVVEAEKNGIDKGNLVAGASRILNELKRRQIMVVIISRNSRETITDVFKHYQLPDPDLIVGLEDVTKTKPDPEAVEVALQKFNLRKDECVLVGDTLHDMEMGNKAGLFRILLVNPRLTHYPKKRTNLVIHSLEELFEFITD